MCDADAPGAVASGVAVRRRATLRPGETAGAATAHTDASRVALVERADVALPASATGASVYVGKWADAPKTGAARVPVVIFLHGSSGLGLKAIGEWSRWLASFGVACVAPDSFALPDRLTYASPASKETYEAIHALRASEIAPVVAALKTVGWCDDARLVLAGASEGAVAVARDDGAAFAARIVYSWSCEDNYFVARHGTRLREGQPVLNVIGADDPYFSQANRYLGAPGARGDCSDAFAASNAATVLRVPQAPHTLLMTQQARAATRAFLEAAVKP